MRFFLHATAKAPLLSPSATFSLAAHLVLGGAAVWGTDVEARQLAEREATRVFFLPPPDRRPPTASDVERLEYVDVGIGATRPGEAMDEGVLAGPASYIRPAPGGPVGTDVRATDAAASVVAEDSVYSILEVDESAARVDGSAAPVYPTALMNEGKEGEVMMRYVVDTSGRADPSSLEVLRSTHPAFTLSVRQALAGMRFAPASVEGRRVRQLVEQRFQFRLQATPPVTADHTRTTPPL